MRQLIIFLLIIFTKTLYAQTPDDAPYRVRISDEIKPLVKLGNILVLPIQNKEIIFYKGFNTEDVEIKIIDSNMQVLREKKFNLEKINPAFKGKVKALYNIENKCYLFIFNKDQKTNTDKAIAVEFSKENLDIIGTPIEIYNVVHSNDVADPKKWTSNIFDRSKDSSLAFLYFVKPVQKNSNPVTLMGINVFDKEFKKKWSKEFEIPHAYDEFDVESGECLNNGKYYQLLKIYKKDSTGKRLSKEYNYKLYMFSEKLTNPVDINIDNKIDYRNLQSPIIISDLKEDIFITGIYANTVDIGEGEERDIADGFFLIKLDEQNKKFININTGLIEIPYKLILEHKDKADEIEKRLTEAGKLELLGVDYLKIEKIYTNQNNSFTIVAEQRNTGIEIIGKNSQKPYFQNPIFFDIYIANISYEGKINWIKKIPKYQSSSKSYGSPLSIGCIRVNTDLHIFYLDNEQNFYLGANEQPQIQDETGGHLIVSKVDSNGVITKSDLGDIQKIKSKIHVRYMYAGNNNNLFSYEETDKDKIIFKSIDVR